MPLVSAIFVILENVLLHTSYHLLLYSNSWYSFYQLTLRFCEKIEKKKLYILNKKSSMLPQKNCLHQNVHFATKLYRDEPLRFCWLMMQHQDYVICKAGKHSRGTTR